MKRVTLQLLLIITVGGAAPAAAAPRLETYVVRPGDSCWSIAERFFGDGERYDTIHEHNDLGPMPHVLQPGQQIKLPADVPGPAARVDWVERKVRARPSWAADWRGATPRMPLWQRHRVATGDRSSAALLFTDRSRLRMRENALVVIYGKQAGAAVQAQRRPGTEIALERGTLRAGLERMDAASELRVRTPGATVGVQPGEAQIGVDGKDTTRVSVFSGGARVRAKGHEVAVPANHGTVVRKGRRPRPAKRLPPAPAWRAGAQRVMSVVVPGAEAVVETAWEEVPGAKGYHVELSSDERFHHVHVDADVAADTRAFRAEGLPAGTHFLRVAAIDRDGLEGSCGPTLRLDVVALQTSRPLLPGADAGRAEAVGFVRLSVPAEAAERLQVVQGDAPPSPLTNPVRLATPGVHTLRFQDATGTPAGSLQLRLLAVTARLEPLPETVAQDAGPLTLVATLRDERDRPAVLPALSARGGAEGSEVSMACAPDGRCTAELPLPPAGGPMAIVVSWPGGSLAQARVEVQPPPASPLRPHWAPPPAVGEPTWALPAPGLPMSSARPVSSLGLAASLAEAPGGEESPLYLALLARGTLALLDGRLGLDAELPWFDAALDDDPAGANELGDLRVGARWLATTSQSLRVAPRLALRLPTGGFPRPSRSVWIEPGVLVDWELSTAWELGTQQTLVIQTGQDTSLVYAAGYRALWLPLRRLGIGAQLDTLFDLNSDRLRQALSAGLGVHLLGPRSRLGLVVAGALNDDARDMLGRFTLGVGGDVTW